jgi:hypothetical protein
MEIYEIQIGWETAELRRRSRILVGYYESIDLQIKEHKYISSATGAVKGLE